MYVKRNTVYADPYTMISKDGVTVYQGPGPASAYTEVSCPVDGMTVDGGIARWGRCAMAVRPTDTYETLKTRLVKVRYSNDDQIAIMLNADPEEMRRMQAWREWATDVARRICRCLGIGV